MELNLNAYGLALIPVLVGVIQLLKLMGLPPRWSPLVALVGGLILGLAYVAPGDWRKGVLAGVVLALAAVGLWSGPKNTAQLLNGDAGASADAKGE